MMAPVPFVNAQQSGHEALAGASPLAVNVVADAMGAVRRRPGIKTSTGILTTAVDSNGLDALHVAHNGQFYGIGGLSAGRKVYRIGATATEFTGGSARLTGLADRPVVAETEAMVLFSAGAYIQKVEFSTQLCDRLGGTPPQATHVIAHNARLLANNKASEGEIDFSDTALGSSPPSLGLSVGHETWSGLNAGFFNAEARPDPIRALHENTNEVFAFGSTNVQVFVPDPTTTYSPVAAREYGCIAPYSVVKADQSFMWLDDRRRFVLSDGREFNDEVGKPIQQTIDDMPVVNDCFGYRIHLGPVDAYVWTFPTDQRTFVYQKGVGWGQWSGWNSTYNHFKRFMVNCHHRRADTGQNLVGTTDGKVGEFSNGTYTDLGDPIEARIDTGYINRDTDVVKHCEALFLTVKKVTASDSTKPPVGLVSWRDDGGSWCSPLEVAVDDTDREVVVDLRGLGTYRRREWRFSFSGPDELVLVGAKEQFREGET